MPSSSRQGVQRQAACSTWRRSASLGVRPGRALQEAFESRTGQTSGLNRACGRGVPQSLEDVPGSLSLRESRATAVAEDSRRSSEQAEMAATAAERARMSEAVAAISDAMKAVEPRHAALLQMKLKQMLHEYAALERAVQEQAKKNSVLQREADDRRRLLARVSDLGFRGRLFSRENQTPTLQRAWQLQEEPLVQESRRLWERSRMAEEELREEVRLHFEREAFDREEEVRKRGESKRLREAEDELQMVSQRVRELVDIREAAKRMVPVNQELYRQLMCMTGDPPRWR